MTYVVYAGEEGRVVLDILQRKGERVLGFFDDNISKKEIESIPVLGKLSDIEKICNNSDRLVIAIGDNQRRAELIERFKDKYSLKSVISQSAEVSHKANIGIGCIVHPGVIINTGADIGEGVLLNTRSIVEHDCNIGNYVNISPGAILQGGVIIGKYTYINSGANIREDISIGTNTTIGMGSVVTKSIGNNVTAYGNPARII